MNGIKVDKNKFLAVAFCSRREFQKIVDIMMEYEYSSDSGGKDDVTTVCNTVGSHDPVQEITQAGNVFIIVVHEW